MKHSTKTLTDPSTPYELRAIQLLNSDLNRSYPQIDLTPGEGRSKVVHDALGQCSNVFKLCRETSRIARIVHNPYSSRIAVSITWALRKIAEPPAKLPAAADFAELERLTA